MTERITRRQLLRRGAGAMQGMLAASLFGGNRLLHAGEPTPRRAVGADFAGTAKQILYLNMVGGPSQMDLFDYKPGMQEWYDKDIPESVRNGQRLTAQTSSQKRFPIAPSKYAFSQFGGCGMWISELLPHLSRHADDICLVRSLNTDEINHEPAMTHMQTGSPLPGRPSIGSWVSYALGPINPDLPAYVVLMATPTNRELEVNLPSRMWSAGFLPGEHAGVALRGQGEPILYVTNPPGISSAVRGDLLAGLKDLNALNFSRLHDPDTLTRTAQYEMAMRMQGSVPDLVAMDREPDSVFALYGEEARKPGTFAYQALMARRLLERGVRFVQIHHNNWDEHANLAFRMPLQCGDVDQPCAALIEDLRSRGMLDNTLVIWGGEFGRTIYAQGALRDPSYGRDHHPRCFSMWMCGGGMKSGYIHGETDEFSYNVVKDPVHVRDLHATILHALGLDHERLTYPYQGLDARLTGVEKAKVVKEILK